MKRHSFTALGAASLIAISTLAAAPAALATPAITAATPAPRGACNSSYYYYRFTNTGGVFQQAGGSDSAVAGQGGVTLSISTAHSYTVGGSVTGTVSTEAGVIFAKASASLSVSISASYTGTTTTGGSWTVPTSWGRGKLSVGTNSQKFNWSYGHDTPNCAYVQSKGGSGVGPKENFLTFIHTRLS